MQNNYGAYSKDISSSSFFLHNALEFLEKTEGMSVRLINKQILTVKNISGQMYLLDIIKHLIKKVREILTLVILLYAYLL